MKDKSLILVLGESTGLECLKEIIKKKKFHISLIVCIDKNYYFPVKKICKKNKISFLDRANFMKSFKKIQFMVNKKYILISIFSNMIIDDFFLRKFKGAAFNLHPGILPYYPGKNCVSGAIYNNEKFAGVTLHKMTKKIDGGSILKIKTAPIYRKDNLLTVMSKLKILGIKLINEFTSELLENKKIKLIQNKIYLKKKYPKKIPNDGLINPNIKYIDFKNLVRSSYFGPFKNTWGKLNFIHKNKKKFILRTEELSNGYLKNEKNYFFLKHIKNNEFILKIGNKFLKVLTE